ncbi:hypothetical protein QUI_3362 [Clostridioides difficile P59]|nr:hypothetical protein QUI_3362 [Clostridioides difficile P59]
MFSNKKIREFKKFLKELTELVLQVGTFLTVVKIVIFGII